MKNERQKRQTNNQVHSELQLRICMLEPHPYRPDMFIDPTLTTSIHLANLGHQVTWILSSYEDRQVRSFFFKDVHVYLIPRVQFLPGSSVYVGIANKILDTLRRLRLIPKIIERENCNIVFTRGEEPSDGLIAAYVKRKYKIPLVFRLVDPLEQEWETWKLLNVKPRFVHYLIAKFNVLVKSYVMKKAALVIPSVSGYKEALVKKGIAASKVISSAGVGVDITLFSNQNGRNVREKYALSDSKLVIYVGTLDKPRCLNVLIQAFSKVKEERHSKLLIVGEGSDEENLKRLVYELGMREDVVFTGRVPQPDVPCMIAAADIGISPVPPFSFYQASSPIKVHEYMAMGKPVVANQEIPDHKAVLEQSGGGILVSFTAEAFANAIIELIDDPERAAEMGRRGREWISNNRTYEIISRELETQYQKLLGV